MTANRPILLACRGIAPAEPSRPTAHSILFHPVTMDSGGGAWRVLAVGSPEEVASHPDAESADTFDLPHHVLTPAFVNAHTHLDLTHMGPQPFDPSISTFADWVGTIRNGRRADPREIARSVDEGVARSIAGGVIAIGDIAGVASTTPLDTLRASPLHGVSFIEYFGLGPRQNGSIEQMRTTFERTRDSENNVVRALHPHAPYSAGPRLFQSAAELSRTRRLPICAHLAETPDEIEFIRAGTGAIAGFLDTLGLLDEHVRADVGRGLHPIEHVEPALRAAPFILAHLNECPIGAERILAETGATVAYCPRAHAYFGHERTLGPHPYERLIDAGVPVAVATDSIVNIPTDQSDRISPLDDARLLRATDGLDARALLRMITTIPARALGLDERLFTIEQGTTTLAFNALRVGPGQTDDPALAALDSDAIPTLLSPDIEPSRTLETLRRPSR